MLTSDLLRYTISDEFIKPRYLTRKHANFYLKIASDLLAIYKNHIGKKRAELDEALVHFEGNWSGYKIVRGLSKIIEGMVEWAPEQAVDYAAMRRQLFEAVENFRPIVRHADLMYKNTRAVVLQQISNKKGPLPRTLYGDLPDNNRLKKFTHSLTAEELIRRYNLALAQGLLYRCIRMRVWLWDSYKTVFHYLKLAGLIHFIRKQGDHFYLHLDGPLSLFRRTQKYGINFARFLPGLMLAEHWKLSADIQTEKGLRQFVLDQNCGLHSHYQKDDPFDSTVEQALYKGFQKRKTLWDIRREAEIIDLGNTVLIPDFTFIHPDGVSVLLEIVGFWTPDYLNKKLNKIDRAKRTDLIIAVNDKLNCTKEQFFGPIIFYKTRVKTSDVLNALEEFLQK